MDKALQNHLPGGSFQDVSPTHSGRMAAIRGRSNRSTEVKLRMALVRAQIRGWLLRPKGIRGSPDFLFPKGKVIVFVDGCFWHGCPKCAKLAKVRENRSYWATKIAVNKNRDRQTTRYLRAHGYLVLRLWEHDLLHDKACLAKISELLNDEPQEIAGVSSDD